MNLKQTFAAAALGLLAAGGPALADAVTIGEGKRPTIASDAKGGLHAAYEAFESGSKTPDIFYTSSTDGGKTWAKPADISNTPGVSEDPSIAVNPKSGAIVCVWTDTSEGEKSPDIFFTSSTDGGKTWAKAANISKTPGVSKEPAVACGGDGSIHVVWSDTSEGEASPDVWHSGSMDGGKTWSKPANISNTPGVSSDPAVAVGHDGAVFVCWCDTSEGAASPDIWATHSTDGGKSWAKPANVSNTPGVSANPDIAVDGKGNVYLTWSDTSQGEKSPDIFFSVSRDGGKTYGGAVNISNTPGVSSDPAIAADAAGHVAVIWCDTSAGEQNPDIWFAVSGDGGKSFGKPADLSNTPGVSKQPDVTIAGGHVVGIWEEEEGGKSLVKVASSSLK
jgi:hypothetical protein